MAHKVGKYKVSKREQVIDLHDTENSSPASLAVDTDKLVVAEGGGVTVGSTTNPGDNNLRVEGTLTQIGAVTVGTDGSGVDVTFYSGTSGDKFLWDASEEKLQITGTAGADALEVADGDVLVTKGNVVLGANSTQAGNLTLWDGSGGNTPAWILLHSCDGTAAYFFAANDGTLRRHSSAPTANGDGSAV